MQPAQYEGFMDIDNLIPRVIFKKYNLKKKSLFHFPLTAIRLINFRRFAAPPKNNFKQNLTQIFT